MAKIEYSKILRWNVTGASRGMQATITLPSADSVQISRYGGFVTAYVAIKFGGYSYECGLSTDINHYKLNQWHWTSATSDDEPSRLDGDWGQFHSGDTVNLKLTIDDVVQNGYKFKKLRFYVNSNLVRTFVRDFASTDNFNEARLIIAANHETYESEAQVPNPLPAWGVVHNQIVASGLMHKNTSNTWVAVNSSNSTPPSATEKNPSNRQHQGVPLNYTMTVLPASSMIYAALKV
ncbi:hypothetical protein MKZ21_30685 [Paenibacillus sp. FSL P2-0536]|uniref:hypothetical protein n=1 Tax=Paenibacillus sp. FSL P2-0536 TaxID=2921629 RepID=UPI0030F9BA9B